MQMGLALTAQIVQPNSVNFTPSDFRQAKSGLVLNSRYSILNTLLNWGSYGRMVTMSLTCSESAHYLSFLWIGLNPGIPSGPSGLYLWLTEQYSTGYW